MKRHKHHFATATLDLYCDNQRSPHTATNAHYRLLSFARWLESEYHVTDLEAVTTAHILAYKAHLADNGLAASSQARTIETLRGFFRFCYAEHLIAHDPAAQVKSPRPLLNKEPEYLTVDESRRLLNSVDRRSPYGKRDKAILWALAFGLRVSEVVGLNCGDMLLPDKARKLPGLRVTGKGVRQRIVPICPQALKALSAYLKHRQDSVAPASPLFICTYEGQNNRRMSVDAVQERFKVACQRARIAPEKAHCHSFRHSFCMRMMYEAGANIYTTARLMGHASISVTERYLHLRREALEEAVMRDPLARG